MPAGSGSLDQQRSEPLHPAIDRHVVDINTALGQQVLDIPVGL
jgi:hypothetical protein